MFFDLLYKNFNMRYLVLFLLAASFISCETKQKQFDGKFLLEKSSQFHDKKNEWNTTDFAIHIQEPRFGNPYRYSIVSLNNKNNSFELQRNREQHISTHKIDENGSVTLLDGEIITDSLLIKKYRLESKRNKRYYRFYKTLLGLPMSLKDEIKEINDVEKTIFNSIESYKIPIELKKPLFSKHWVLYLSKKEHKILGLEMIFPDDKTKGERLIFDGEFLIESIRIPRIRHWYELNGEYSGSDIIVSKTEN